MNTFNTSFRPVVVEPVLVSDYAPGLRAKFLLAPDAAFALVRYEGIFGSRTISDTALLTRNGKYVNSVLPAETLQAFRLLCEVLLAERFEQWWHAEGAEGRFLWDIASDTLEHQHNLRDLLSDIKDDDEPSFADPDIPF